MKERTILHCDLNNFYASVDCALNPGLEGKCVAVCGNKEHRHGIVLAKNQLAKSMGVATGETIAEAKKKCPSLVIVLPHYEYYVQYAKKIHEIYKRYTDKVESFGLDECWLDVTNSEKLFGDGKQIADRLRKEVKEETNLTISVGVSFCKVFAKLGSDLKKPDATTVISRDNFKSVVWKLPVSDMLMIGRKTLQKLSKYHIVTIGDLARADESLLKYVFGINGVKMKQWANGEDDAPVEAADVSLPVKSIGHSTTTIVDVCDLDTAKQVVWFLSDMIGVRLRQQGLLAHGISVCIRYNTLNSLSKQTQMSFYTFDGGQIADSAFSLLKTMWQGQSDVPLRLIGVSVFDLNTVAQDTQESLFDSNREKKEQLNFTLDKIRKKYGYQSLQKGIMMNNSVMTDKSPIEDTEFLPFKKLN